MQANLSASEIGDYLYCARAAGLRHVVDGAADPTSAALAAQGLTLADRPLAALALTARQHRRATRLAQGRANHRRHDRGLILARGLVAIGLLLIVLALLVGVADAVVQARLLPWPAR